MMKFSIIHSNLEQARTLTLIPRKDTANKTVYLYQNSQTENLVAFSFERIDGFLKYMNFYYVEAIHVGSLYKKPDLKVVQ